MASQVELDVANGDRDADLDVLFLRGRDFACDEIADAARRLAAGAGVADAHAAAEPRAEPGLFGLLEKGTAAVRNPPAGLGEAHSPLGAVAGEREGRGEEALDVK